MQEPADLILPGLKPVVEFLRSNPARIKKILVKRNSRASGLIAPLAEQANVPVSYCDESQLDKLCAQDSSGHISHQGAIATLSAEPPASIESLLAKSAPLPLAIAMDQIQDPGNLGTICRTAWALGCIGLILPEHNSAKPGPAALRSSAGSLALMPVSIVANLARSLDLAEEAGFFIYGAGHATGRNCKNAFQFHWQLPAVLVLGSENRGLRPNVAKRCSELLEIPLQRAFDSLNVAQAGAILIALCAAACAKN